MIKEIKITSLTGRGSVTMKDRDYKEYWLGPVDWGRVQGEHQTYEYYNQVGQKIVGTKVGERSLSIIGWVVDGGAGDLRRRCDFLNAFISPVEDYILEYQGKKIQFRPDASIGYGKDKLKNNELVRQFLITATMPYPLFSDAQNTASAFDSSGKLFRFPQNFGRTAPVVFGSQKKTYSVEVHNAGGFQTGMLIKLRFSGEVQNPRIKNLTTEGMAGVRRTFNRGETLEIDTAPGKKKMLLTTADGKEQNIMKHRDVNTTWRKMLLAPGRNLLTLDCDSLDQRAAMSVTVFYTPLYLEVE